MVATRIGFLRSLPLLTASDGGEWVEVAGSAAPAGPTPVIKMTKYKAWLTGPKKSEASDPNRTNHIGDALGLVS
ncbi:hypothetical protein K435DRAFT_872404 [Dendrothele bispora CBS 962.96]|uniref:Uncharacterized protein n=1 Tax=Dendrothele bispora (strain CBS 962.96) TaxID=1314807 RepID=A0A4S8L1M3_DENBC|nr:hypothetical protein K435DRAFT_872404 [Dendrothele bispora CBS 962.96]